jgi:uncharacterized protein
MDAIRYDAVPLKATLTPEGYIVDTPVLGRTGVQTYKRADGRIVREYRPPTAVFDPVFLSSIRGRPIVNGHPGRVNSQNVRAHAIGTMLSEGRQDGRTIRGDIIIHDTTPVLKDGKRELSLGYVVTVRDEAGVSPDGEHYDAVQDRLISCDHLAVVERGRSGCAKLNLDGEDAAEVTEDDGSDITVEIPTTTMETTIVAEQHAPASAPPSAARLMLCRIDGIEYEVAPQVARDIDRMREQIKAATVRADTAEAERDNLQAAVTKHDGELAQAKVEAATVARARVKLEMDAAKHGVEVRSDMTDRSLREAVIRKVRGGEQSFEGRSDDYLSAAFDLAVTEAARSAEQNAKNRVVVQGPVPAAGVRADIQSPQLVSANAWRDRMIRASTAR